MPQSSKASEVFPFLYLGAEGDLTEQGRFYEIREKRSWKFSQYLVVIIELLENTFERV